MNAPILAFAVACALITVWTIGRLWRRATDRYTQLVYTFGVKAYGLAWLALTTLDQVTQGVSPRRLAIHVLVGVPISLWAGYAFGRGLAWFYGLPRSDQ